MKCNNASFILSIVTFTFFFCVQQFSSKFLFVFSKDFQRRPKISEDIPNNSEVLKKMIMLHMNLHISEISVKVLSFTHFTRTFVSCIGLSLQIFGKSVN